MTGAGHPTHEAFLSKALDRLNEVARDRAERISAAEEGLLSTLWAAIIVAVSSPWVFASLFSESDVRLHYLMVAASATVLALQIPVILVLCHPFSGDLAVDPDPFVHVVRDFGG